MLKILEYFRSNVFGKRKQTKKVFYEKGQSTLVHIQILISIENGNNFFSFLVFEFDE